MFVVGILDTPLSWIDKRFDFLWPMIRNKLVFLSFFALSLWATGTINWPVVVMLGSDLLADFGIPLIFALKFRVPYRDILTGKFRSSNGTPEVTVWHRFVERVGEFRLKALLVLMLCIFVPLILGEGFARHQSNFESFITYPDGGRTDTLVCLAKYGDEFVCVASSEFSNMHHPLRMVSKSNIVDRDWRIVFLDMKSLDKVPSNDSSTTHATEPASLEPREEIDSLSNTDSR